MYHLYFDGGSRGNPGISGSGAVLYKDGAEISHMYHYCGDDKTNNFAEYTGLLKGVELLISLNLNPADVIVKGDSKLVICQCKGEYKVSNLGLKELYSKLQNTLKSYTGFSKPKLSDYFSSMIHIPRENNKRADALSNVAMNLRSSS